MPQTPALLLLLAAAALGLTACQPQPSEPEEIGNRVYEVRGVVQDVRKDGQVLIIDHEEIPGYMRQMIMPFRVSEDEPAIDLAPGEEIEFTYEVAEVKSWIYGIEKTGQTKAVKLADPEDIPDPKDVPVLTVGDILPDYAFQDENGTDIQLSQYRGQPVAMTFVFTRCPVPEYCPAMMRKFEEVEEALKADPNAPEKWKLLSISFDAWHDTPEIMTIYGEAYGRDTNNWGLLSTKDCCTINEIGGNVGLKFADKDGSFIHNLRTVVLDKEGKIVRLFVDGEWEVADLVAEMKRLG